MNLPNALTLARIFLVPLLVVVLLTKFEGHLILGVRKELVGAAIFGLASLTDWLDGDVYYRTNRPGQNLDRARAQLRLLRSMPGTVWSA